jgi:hypothetical protein
MNRLANHLIERAVWVVAAGMIALPVLGGDLGIDIHIGSSAPPPPVIVREEVVVREPVVYETYVVGYRRDLYDADLKLRIARADEWQAHEELNAARRHEGELVVALDEQEAVIARLRDRVGDREEGAAELHVRVESTAEAAGDLRKKLGALEHRIAAAREDYEAAQVLHDRDGMSDASDRIKANEGRAAAASVELREAEERLEHLRKKEAIAAAIAADRERLHEARESAGELRHKLDLAHDAVYVTQNRLTASQDAAFAALHDRDEALWLLHRDEILAGRFEPERCGFHIDLSVWGGRMPRDPEVLHAYCVHDAGYWRANPVYVEERIVIADRAPEVTRIREVQRVREVERIERVEKVELVVKVEDRRRVAEVSVVERKRFEAETFERKSAAAEHRAPRPVYIERPANVKTVNNVNTVNNVSNVNNVSTVSNVNNNTNVSNNTTVNKNTVVNNNVTNVTKVGGNPKEEARLRAEVESANAKADAVKKGQAEEAARVQRDEAKLAEQSKQIEQGRQNDKRQADEIAKIRADQERIDKKVGRAAAEKPVTKAPEKTADKVADKGSDKAAERRADRTPEKQPAESRPVADAKRTPAPAPAPADSADASSKNRRRGDAPDPAPAPSASARKDGKDAKAPPDPRDAKNPRDPRAPRDGQTSIDDTPHR